MMLDNENIQLMISFIVLIYFTYRPIKKLILKILDANIEEIRQKLAEAEKLKDEAYSLFNKIQNDTQHFHQHQEEVLENARANTAELVKTKTREMELMMNRKREAVIKFIENQKNKATGAMRDEFIDVVVPLVRQYLLESKNNNVADEEIITRLLPKERYQEAYREGYQDNKINPG